MGSPFFFGLLLGSLRIGAAGYFYRPVPWLLAGLVVLAYLTFVAWMAVGVAGCPHCEEHDGFDRLSWFTIVTLLYGFFAAAIVGVIGAGALIASWLRRSGQQ